MSDSEQFQPNRLAFASRLNWLRAGILGANDGIVSIAALLVGVAAATTDLRTILIAGVAGIVAGSISMAAGEYVSVSSQRDSEKALIARERKELLEQPDEEEAELAQIYESKGLTPSTARLVARELTAHDAISAHLEAELGINERQLTNPWHAALSSALAFLAGALLPMLAITLPAADSRIPFAFAASLLALAITGFVGARLGESPALKPVLRVLAGGTFALLLTWGIGTALGVAGI